MSKSLPSQRPNIRICAAAVFFDITLNNFKGPICKKRSGVRFAKVPKVDCAMVLQILMVRSVRQLDPGPLCNSNSLTFLIITRTFERPMRR